MPSDMNFGTVIFILVGVFAVAFVVIFALTSLVKGDW